MEEVNVSAERRKIIATRDYVAKTNIVLIQLLRSLKYEIHLLTPRNAKSSKTLIVYTIGKIINSLTKEKVFDIEDYPANIERKGYTKKFEYILIHRHRIEVQIAFMMDLLEEIMDWEIKRYKPAFNKTQLYSIDLPVEIDYDDQMIDFENLIEMYFDQKLFEKQFNDADESDDKMFILPPIDYKSPVHKK